MSSKVSNSTNTIPSTNNNRDNPHSFIMGFVLGLATTILISFFILLVYEYLMRHQGTGLI